MTDEIADAFAHPEARAAATAGADPLDRISLRDHVVELEIGAFQSERGTTQRVCFNIVVEIARLDGPVDDDVDRILSYDKVTEAIAAELAAERLNLLETLAERIARRLLAEPQAHRVFVRIEKLDRGPGALGVEIVRSRSGPASPAAGDEDGPRPTVVYLSNAAIADPGLGAAIDRMQRDDAPLIFCVGLPDSAPPQSGNDAAQRRIDLLAIEQNAWVLAGRDRRCVVRGSRTELDWALKHGEISVWAPSKMVLDAVAGPKGGAVALALWLAEALQARELRVIGATPPSSVTIPARAAALID